MFQLLIADICFLWLLLLKVEVKLFLKHFHISSVHEDNKLGPFESSRNHVDVNHIVKFLIFRVCDISIL